MAKSTCSVRECRAESEARGLCGRHYGMAYRRGELPPLQPKQLMLGVHSLSNVDRDARIADCAVCGPQVPIRVRERRNRGGLECMNRIMETKRNGLLAGKRGGSKADRAASHRRALLKKYGLTPADYERMYAEQQGRCGICRQEHPRLFVDHDHETEVVRGLLCFDCNVALGWLRDRQDSAIQAAHYLRTHQSA